MKNTPNPPTRSINPRHLGPVTKQPAAAGPPPALFPGDLEFLGKGRLRRRAALWSQVSPLLDKILTPGEQILHVAEAMQKVSVFRTMTMGMMVYAYHQVALVLTDKRLIEVLLDTRGKRPESRIRSVPWRALSEMRMRLGQLRLRLSSGKWIAWSLRVRGDRKLISALLPRMTERGLIGGAASAEKLPAVHCPGCGDSFRDEPDRCHACGTLHRSKRLARVLSVAFPGAGLFYLGHPVLGTFDLIGELMLFVFLAVILAVAPDSAAIATGAGMGGFLLLLTKLESLHIGEILSERLRQETDARRERWRKFSMGGAFVSGLALVVIVAATGSLAAKIDRDLDFTRAGSEWYSTREAADSELFPDDPALRSEWIHADGWTVSVFAYPLSLGESFEAMREAFVASEAVAAHSSLREAGDLPPTLSGFRALQIESAGEDGPPMAYLNYFIYDEEGKDLHQLLMIVPEEETETADQTLRSLLQTASWVAPPAP